MPMMRAVDPVRLRDVATLVASAERSVAAFVDEYRDVLRDAEVHHIGATALPFGHTKGDVDLNLRTRGEEFAALVAALRARLEVAQPQNWTATFASFVARGYELPLGVQVTVIESPDDFLLALRDQMRADPELLRRYDLCKRAAAANGKGAYWDAKNSFLQAVLRRLSD